MNKIFITGRLTKDVDLKFSASGTAVANLTVAVNRRFKKESQPNADFINCVIWGKQAESTANYMSKGCLIGIVGRMETRSYDAKDGTKRYVTEVIADEVEFLDYGKKDNQSTTDNSSDYTEVSTEQDCVPF